MQGEPSGQSKGPIYQDVFNLENDGQNIQEKGDLDTNSNLAVAGSKKGKGSE